MGETVPSPPLTSGVPNEPSLAYQAIEDASTPNIHHNYQVLSPTEPSANGERRREEDMAFFDLGSFTNAYLDYVSFSHPWDDTSPNGVDWSTLDFCEVRHESGNYLSRQREGDACPMPIPAPNGVGGGEFTHTYEGGDTHPTTRPPEVLGATQRLSSPPSLLNYPSNEEPCPFTSPNHGSHMQPISIGQGDPLLQNHNPKFDITVVTWGRLRQFLSSCSTSNGTFTLPPLGVTNVFIELFFKLFSHTAPVLHEPTLNTDTLSLPLLAVMVAIGAEQSRVRGTRYFAMLLLDHVRCNIQTAIETDRSITRDPVIIYSYALICYAGIWCGNKWVFDIAETLRGMLVTYIRRLSSHRDTVDATADIKDQWSAWTKIEFKRRLMWFVFMIDAQFPALLNMKSMLSLSEVAKWQCPCDEGYWVAPSALIWKRLLGPASLPPAPHFALAIAPFTCQIQSGTAVSEMPTYLLNPWSSFFVVLSLSHSALEWSHNWTLTVSTIMETTEECDVGNVLFEGQADKRYRHLTESRQAIIGKSCERDFYRHAERI